MAKRTKKKREGEDPHSAMNPDLRKTLALTQTGTVYMYESMGDVTLTPKAIEEAKIWETVEELMMDPKIAIHNIYENLTSVSPPTRWDKEELALETWIVMCERARRDDHNMADPESRQGATVDRGGSGKRGKRRKLDDRSYVVSPIPEDGLPLMPPQAKICYEIMVAACDENHTVMESRLRAAIMEDAERLKTRQDPWRIFQYYRPQLIAARLVRMPPME